MMLYLPYVVGGAAALLLLVIVFKILIQIPAPNEAILVSGLWVKTGDRKFRIVTGGKTTRIPGFQTVTKVHLDLNKILMTVPCTTAQGVQVNIDAVVLFKVGNSDDFIERAAIRFPDRNFAGMQGQLEEVFDGFLRETVGALTVEQLLSQRKTLAAEGRDAISSRVEVFGLVVEALQIKGIRDIEGSHYIQNLGRAQSAAVLAAAEIAEADKQRESAEKKAEAAALIAAAERESAVKQAGFQAQIDKANAESKQAGPLAEALARQEVVKTDTETARLEAARREQQLDTEVRKPADAKAYAETKAAEASKASTILEAEAAAAKTRLEGEAHADATRQTGEAEAAAKKALGLAEAEAARALNEALGTNPEGVIGLKLANVGPELVANAAGAFTGMDMTVFNGADGLEQILGKVLALAGTGKQFYDALSVSNGSSNGQKETATAEKDDGRVLVRDPERPQL